MKKFIEVNNIQVKLSEDRYFGRLVGDISLFGKVNLHAFEIFNVYHGIYPALVSLCTKPLSSIYIVDLTVSFTAKKNNGSIQILFDNKIIENFEYDSVARDINYIKSIVKSYAYNHAPQAQNLTESEKLFAKLVLG